MAPDIPEITPECRWGSDINQTGSASRRKLLMHSNTPVVAYISTANVTSLRVSATNRQFSKHLYRRFVVIIRICERAIQN